MSTFSRRNFLKSLGGATAATAVTAFPGIIKAATSKPKVLVVGGGFAGATAAKYIRHWSKDIEVTLIEPSKQYVSPILSNLVLNNGLIQKNITFNYSQLSQKYGVNVVTDWVQGLDTSAHQVTLSDGSKLDYDRLILAPGVTFDNIDGLDSNKVPHAWKAGSNLLLLKEQLQAMPDGGSFIITIPPAPYRCPPGPYERACVVADYLRKNKPSSRVIVLDANPGITAEKETFRHAFEVTYADILEYIPNVNVLSVDSDQRSVHTDFGDYDADVLNVIPTHKAGSIILDSNLANSSNGRWANVNPLSYESTVTPDVHIIGDSQGTGQPKAGHIANAEAKVCADAVIRLISGGQPYAAPMTNSSCFSPITADTASWLTAVFAYDEVSGKMKVVPGSGGEAHAPSRENFKDMFEWANGLFADTFG